MIGLSTHADDAAGTIPAGKITAAAYHTESGVLIVTCTGKSGEPITRTMGGQDGADLYNALLAIQAATCEVVSPPPPEPPPEVEPPPETEEPPAERSRFGRHPHTEPPKHKK